jgi:hypothetical protein
VDQKVAIQGHPIRWPQMQSWLAHASPYGDPRHPRGEIQR